ncbi:MAG: glycosyltransferase family 2 protein [bacterium]
MTNISACIITKNEENDIRDCLESVTWADEIIVVDDGSTDKTLEIARQFTDKIYQQSWLGYGRQKQSTVDKASGEWILSIDADERVTPELAKEIQLIAHSSSVTSASADKQLTVNGYEIPFRFYFLNHLMRFGGCGGEKHLRLFKKAKGSFSKAAIHEGIEIKGNIGKLKNHMLHFSYQDKEEYFKKLDIYTTLDAEKRFKAGKKAGWKHTTLLPGWEFLVKFIFKLGFLDGVYGFYWALYSSQYVYAKYAKLSRLANENKK